MQYLAGYPQNIATKSYQIVKNNYDMTDHRHSTCTSGLSEQLLYESHSCINWQMTVECLGSASIIVAVQNSTNEKRKSKSVIDLGRI